MQGPRKASPSLAGQEIPTCSPQPRRGQGKDLESAGSVFHKPFQIAEKAAPASVRLRLLIPWSSSVPSILAPTWRAELSRVFAFNKLKPFGALHSPESAPTGPAPRGSPCRRSERTGDFVFGRENKAVPMGMQLALETLLQPEPMVDTARSCRLHWRVVQGSKGGGG